MASKKKGLSLDEKKQRLLDLLFEKKEFFQLKELEKLGPKEKGIVAQSVKDVLQQLVDDGLVDCEKIGTLTCFWAFPSKALAARKRKITTCQDEMQTLREKAARVDKELTVAAEGKEQTENRQQMETFLSKLERENNQVKEQLAKYDSSNPDHLLSLQKAASVAAASANRWTDNIFSVKSWCKKKFSMEEAVLNKQFGIPEDFDYVE